MSTQQPLREVDLDERTRRAIAELRGAILARYPTTVFELARSPEDPASLHLLAVADVDDPDEVGDLVVERVVELQVEEGIPVHVIPLRTPERVRAALAPARGAAPTRPFRSERLLGEIA